MAGWSRVNSSWWSGCMTNLWGRDCHCQLCSPWQGNLHPHRWHHLLENIAVEYYMFCRDDENYLPAWTSVWRDLPVTLPHMSTKLTHEVRNTGLERRQTTQTKQPITLKASFPVNKVPGFLSADKESLLGSVLLQGNHLKQKPWVAAVLKSFSGTLWLSGIVLTVHFLDQAAGNTSRLCFPGLLMNCQVENIKKYRENEITFASRICSSQIHAGYYSSSRHLLVPTGFIFQYFPAQWKMYKSLGPLLLVL